MSFFQTYQEEHQDFGEETFQCASDTVTKLLETATSSEHPGMLLGKVQSGKTRTFISILADAFDRGFDIAIVLSKNSKALIEQTVKRLESEFETFTDDGDFEIHDIMLAPKQFSKFELQAKQILVGKKQTHNLDRLIKLFGETCPDMAKMRVLIIDDEADNASIGYARKEGEIEATTIATKISELRDLIEEVSFLQVTATPYSLYLQPGDIDVNNVISFQPTRPAFTSLVPVPDAYVGGDTYFGEAARSQEPTVESLIHHVVDHREFDVLKTPDRRRLKVEESLESPAITGYRHAIVNFILGGCIQILNAEANGENSRKLRYSFLVHSEAGKNAHAHQESITHKLAERLTEEAAADSNIFRELLQASYDDLAESIHLSDQALPSFDDVHAKVREALGGDYLTIVKVNSDEQVATMLDKTGQLKLRSPLNIFIGGQVLDRGVTLANLIGFYYGRRPQKYQQDTVLQHSRMYGYRRHDLAVTRFYTSNIIRAKMFEMEEFDDSLRSAIEAGGDRSVQFIRRSQDGRVVPCSPNKILVTTTQTLKPFKRILPVGFQTGHRTGQNGIGTTIEAIDQRVVELCAFNADTPVLVSLEVARELLDLIEPTMHFDDPDAPLFDWEAAHASLCHLSQQHPVAEQRNQVLLWAANDRNTSRMVSETSHSKFAENPDSPRTEGILAKKHAIDTPILFLLRQNGAADKGWRDTSFYWPVIRAQQNAQTAIYTAETIDD